MKSLKKWMSGVAAIAMAIGMAIFAGCGTTTGGNGGGGGNDGPQGEKLSEEEIQAVIDKLYDKADNPGQSFSFEFVGKATDQSSYFTADSAEAERTESSVSDLSVAVKANLADGDADMSLTYTNTVDGEPITSQEEGIFIRDWNMFRQISGEETGGSDDVLVNEGAIPIDELLGGLTSGDDELLSQEVNALVALPAPAVMQLAKQYEAVTSYENVLTVNVNAIVYGLYTEFVSLVDSFELTTTLGDIFASDFAKDIVSALTYGMTGEELYAAVCAILDTGMIEELAGGNLYPGFSAELKQLLPIPAEDDSVYDYFVKVLESEEIGNKFGISYIPYSDVTVGQIISLISLIHGEYTLEDLKADIRDGVECTQTSFEIVTEDATYGEMAFKAENVLLKIDMTQEQSVSVLLTCDLSARSEYQSNGYDVVEEASVELSLETEYSADKQQLAEIDEDTALAMG